ncbi:D-ribose pyranase [Corynebacterium sp. TAE3-ERU2]|uniref:D-ribose pyranase n=1 Tax=Corynebacterium sp. TAE3-ERU2 TaxID=2849497 RepID=UPI001C4664BC|nr:D-ribose pyranase [Corynebacterium sp. TAE3-ERU2]MBV7302402.1 D-ribose pyranase [Corynebacterium sp. TAE3-ERU2]
MLKEGLSNRDLLRCVSRLGHKDLFAIADVGLPIPSDVEVVDLSIDFGTPEFVPVVERILPHIEIEEITAAHQSPSTGLEALRAAAPKAEISKVEHEALKGMLSECKFVVRTGSVTPYSNAIICCGVPF